MNWLWFPKIYSFKAVKIVILQLAITFLIQNITNKNQSQTVFIEFTLNKNQKVLNLLKKNKKLLIPQWCYRQSKKSILILKDQSL